MDTEYCETFLLILSHNYTGTEIMTCQWAKLDGRKLDNRQRKNSDKYKATRKELKQRKTKSVKAFNHFDGLHNKSGRFH